MANAHLLAFTIIFEGLMTFVGTSPTRNVRMHVALVNTPGHEAFLVLPDKKERLYKNDVITFSLGEGVAEPDDSYDDRVPDLLDHVEHGRLDERILKMEKRDGVLAYVRLPDGKLSGCGIFNYHAVLTKKGGFADTTCMARTVSFTAPPSARKITITIRNESKDPRTFCVKADDVICITNKPPDGVDCITNRPSEKELADYENGELHFHEYSRLLEPGGRVHRSHESKKECAIPKNAPQECPDDNRAPRADCGPTDYP